MKSLLGSKLGASFASDGAAHSIAVAWHVLQVWKIEQLHPYRSRVAAVTDESLARTQYAIERGLWYSPLFVDPFGSILEGTVIYLAAKRLGIEELPVVVIGCEEGKQA